MEYIEKFEELKTFLNFTPAAVYRLIFIKALFSFLKVKSGALSHYTFNTIQLTILCWLIYASIKSFIQALLNVVTLTL